jgi:hypothetical protein
LNVQEKTAVIETAIFKMQGHKSNIPDVPKAGYWGESHCLLTGHFTTNPPTMFYINKKALPQNRQPNFLSTEKYSL